MSMVMIAMIILVPLDFELAAGLAPNEAGIRLIPMTGGTVLGAFIAGQLVSRTGHYRIFPILGAAAMTLLCGAIAALGLGRSWPLDTVLTALLGLSFGFQLPTVIVPVQNALDLADTGIGLSMVMFFRLMGGAFGVALLDRAAGRRAQFRRPRDTGPRRAGTQSRASPSSTSISRTRQPGACRRVAEHRARRILARLYVCRGDLGADHDRLASG